MIDDILKEGIKERFGRNIHQERYEMIEELAEQLKSVLMTFDLKISINPPIVNKKGKEINDMLYILAKSISYYLSSTYKYKYKIEAKTLHDLILKFMDEKTST